MNRLASALVLFVLVLVVSGSVLLLTHSRQQLERAPIQYIEPPTNASIKILWADWKPADFLEILVKDFTAETGIEVTVVRKSWSDWQKHFFAEMKKKSTQYDLVIGDSQWLGFGAEQGHYIDLTEWMSQRNVKGRFQRSTIRGYSEYPKGSGRYWAVPFEGDAMGFAYRKDLFNDPGEQKAFQQRYGYPLKTPKTWYELYDIAEFFYRPHQQLWGVMAWSDSNYDGLTMAVQSVIWAWGGGLGNENSYQVNGYLDNLESVSALSFYKQLMQFNNPEWKHYYLDTLASSNKPLIQGQVAMAMVYFAITPELLDKEMNPYAEQMGFFPTPTGPHQQATSLGGQGISLISYSKKKAQSLKFLEWLIEKETQQRWAELGGLSCHIEVLNSDDFIALSPMHAAFRESLIHVRDFWAVPEYAELLKFSQKHFSHYLYTNDISAKDSLDNLADDWERVFEFHGYYKE